MNIVIDKHMRVKDKERGKKIQNQIQNYVRKRERGKEKMDKFHDQNVYTTY